jgi:hypothetical protein
MGSKFLGSRRLHKLLDSKQLRKQEAKHRTPSNLPEIPAGTIADSSTISESPITDALAGSLGLRAEENSVAQAVSISPSERVWNKAYESLETGEAKLVRAYNCVLKTVLDPKIALQTSDAGADASAELEDPRERQARMRDLVEKCWARVTAVDKIENGVGTFVKIVLWAKPMIDAALVGFPQAALPWAGVCLGLEVSTRTFSCLKWLLLITPDTQKPCRCAKVQPGRYSVCYFQDGLVL